MYFVSCFAMFENNGLIAGSMGLSGDGKTNRYKFYPQLDIYDESRTFSIGDSFCLEDVVPNILVALFLLNNFLDTKKVYPRGDPQTKEDFLYFLNSAEFLGGEDVVNKTLERLRGNSYLGLMHGYVKSVKLLPGADNAPDIWSMPFCFVTFPSNVEYHKF